MNSNLASLDLTLEFAYIQEQFRAVVSPDGGGAVKGSPLHQVSVLDVGAVLQQDLGDLRAPIGAGEVQRRVGVLVLVVHRRIVDSGRRYFVILD